MATTRWDQRFFGSTHGRIVTLLRRSGRTVEGLARALGLTDNGVRARLEVAVAVLGELGGLAEFEEHDGAFVVRSYSCPLTAVVPEHPEEVCRSLRLCSRRWCARRYANAVTAAKGLAAASK